MVTPTVPARDVAGEIADALGEHEREPRALVARAVLVLGAERAQQYLEKTMEVEQQGGMMTSDGTRRRTIGGVYFFLIKQDVRGKEFFRIFLPSGPPKPARTAQSTPTPAKKAVPPAPPSDEVIIEALSTLSYGEVRQVKLTLTGRPKRIEERGDTVIIGLRSEKAPSLPRGLPQPPTGTPFAIFVARKQWLPCQAALQADPDDILVIEAYPVLHPKFAQGITCYATSCTTASLQRTKREAQRKAV